MSMNQVHQQRVMNMAQTKQHKIKETISIRLDNMATLEMVEPGSMDLTTTLAREVANYVRFFENDAYIELVACLEWNINRYEAVVSALGAKTRDVMPELKQRDYEKKIIESRKAFRDSLNQSYFEIIDKFEVLP